MKTDEILSFNFFKTNYEDALPENEPSQPETEPSESVYQTSPPDNKVFLPDVETSEPEYSSSSSSSSVLTSSVRDGSCSPLHYPCGESFPGCCEDAPICKCDRLHFCSCRYRAGPVRPFVKYVAVRKCIENTNCSYRYRTYKRESNIKERF